MKTVTRSVDASVSRVENVTVVTRGASKDMLIAYINVMRQQMNLKPLIIKPELNEQAKIEASRLGSSQPTTGRKKAYFGSITMAKNWYSERKPRVSSFLRSLFGSTPLLKGRNACFSCIRDHRFLSFGIYVYKPDTEYDEPFVVQIFSTAS